MKRLALGEDIAEAAIFLMKSGYVTGEVVIVDGGFSLRS
jgi:NAD(P)-dependent dehydrogenase (short-subunit alcohol dehydrogenase family)